MRVPSEVGRSNRSSWPSANMTSPSGQAPTGSVVTVVVGGTVVATVVVAPVVGGGGGTTVVVGSEQATATSDMRRRAMIPRIRPGYGRLFSGPWVTAAGLSDSPLTPTLKNPDP
jgi:hypothetical protein